MKHVINYLAPIVFILYVIIPPFPVASRDTSITISVDAHLINSLITKSMLDGFTAYHPNVHIKLVRDENLPQASITNMESLDELKKQAAQEFAKADVLYLGSYFDAPLLSPILTRLGYLLNLKPYIDADPTFNPQKLYPPTVANAFNWDNGIWAIPTSVDPAMLIYNRQWFDAAHIAYPSAQWRLDDLMGAIQKLSQSSLRNANSPVMGVNPLAEFTLFLSVYGKPLIADINVPALPALNDLQLSTLFATWKQLRVQQPDLFSFNPDTALALNSLNLLLPMNDPTGKWRGSLLPGGKAGLLTQGFAVSGGTAYPELSYQVAVYLAAHSSFGLDAFNNFGVFPARLDFLDMIMPTLSPDLAITLTDAIAHGMNNADMLYGDYLERATMFSAPNQTPSESLDKTQQRAIADITAVNDSKSRIAFNVIQYVDPPPPPLGKIALNFGYGIRSTGQDQSALQNFVDTFAQNDPAVGRVDLDASFLSLGSAAKQYDCFYQSYNAIPQATDLPSLLNVDPYLTVDPKFTEADMPAAALDQVRAGGHIWGIPMTISPSLLRYSSYRLSKGTLKTIRPDWDVSAFTEFLKAAKTESGAKPPFGAMSGERDHWLMLIGAYGGVPIDYRTDPPTLNLTATKTINAIRQVLDLAKAGYIDYKPLGTYRPTISQSTDDPLMIPDRLSAGFTGQIERNQFEKLIGYPKGSQFTPLSFTISAGFISKDAANPDACYRLLSALATRPDLLLGMPARRSLLDDPALLASQGADAVAYYHQFDTALRLPAALIIPPESDSITDNWIRMWLYQAFDAYVLHNQDLTAALGDAQTKASGFQTCVAALPLINTDPAGVSAVTTCAKKIDPS